MRGEPPADVSVRVASALVRGSAVAFENTVNRIMVLSAPTDKPPPALSRSIVQY
jgi:hypothetical protein